MRLSAIAWRSLTARPARTALTGMGVALGVALVAGTLLTADAATRAVAEAARDLYGEADLRIRAFDHDGLRAESVAAIRVIPGVAISAPLAERRLTLSTQPGPDEQVFTLSAVGVDPLAEAALGRPSLTAGVPLDADRPNGALVAAQWAADHRLDLGDELLLTGARLDTPPLTIVGLLANSGFGAQAGGSVLLVARDTLNAAFEVPSPITAVDVAVAEGRMAEVEAGLDRNLTEPFVVETVADAEAAFARAQAGFAGIAFLLGLVALSAGAFLVANTLAMTLSERTREIGLLRAAGTTGRQVRGLVIRQGLALGLLGSALGLPIGIGIGAILVNIVAGPRTALVVDLTLSPAVLAFSFGLGLGVTLLAAWVPAAEAARVSPLEALRPTHRPGRSLWIRLRWIVAAELAVVAAGFLLYPLERGAPPLVATLLAVGVLIGGAVATAFMLEPLGRLVGAPFERLFGAQGLLGRANLGRHRARTGLSVAALTVALAAVVTLGTTAASARGTAERWVQSILPGGHAIRLTIPSSIDVLQDTIEATPGTLSASPVPEFGVVVTTPEGDREAGVAGIDPSVWQDAGALIVVEADRAAAFEALRGGGAVLLPESFATQTGFRTGDLIHLAIPGGPATDLTVAGLVAYSLPGRSGEGALLISLADARATFGAETATMWAMVPQPAIGEAAYGVLVAEKAAQLAGEALTAGVLAEQLARSLDRLLGLFDALALLAVVIGGLGIVNTLSLGVAERTREIAVLRAHGMTVGQVEGMVVTEAAIMGTVGGIVAAVGGVAVTGVLVTLAPRDFAAGLLIPWPLVIAVVLLGLGVACLAGLYPARLAGNRPVLASLKHFE
ncbi:MAG: FtsX-like permease family protein [Chloroflexota bacterium]